MVSKLSEQPRLITGLWFWSIVAILLLYIFHKYLVGPINPHLGKPICQFHFEHINVVDTCALKYPTQTGEIVLKLIMVCIGLFIISSIYLLASWIIRIRR